MSSQADKIKALLGSGLSNQVVASAVGCDPSYISQLMSVDTFAEEVAQLRVVGLTDATERDRSWDSLEKKLLGKLHEQVDNNMIYKPLDVTRVLAVANVAKRRGSTTPEALTTSRPVVQLNIPTVVIQSYTKTSAGEVIEVETGEGKKQSLLTMSSSALMQQLAAAQKGKSGNSAIDYNKLRRHLPEGPEREATSE